MSSLSHDITAALTAYTGDPAMVERFRVRLAAGRLVREENPTDHFSNYFLPFDHTRQTVLIVAHKKSGLWLFPGGHIEPGESLQKSLNREIQEELGVNNFYSETPPLFLLTIADIAPNNVRPCRFHYDLWFLMPTDGKSFTIDPTEFHETRWVNKTEALSLLTDPTNIQAVQLILK